MGKATWTRQQVVAHVLAGETIVLLRNKVLRIPQTWMAAHPAGALPILHFVGRDATDEVEAFHSAATLQRMNAFIVAELELAAQPWEPLVPPVMSGWVRRRREDGKLEWYSEAVALHSDGENDHPPASSILLVEKGALDSAAPSAPTLATLQPPPTSLSPKIQARHSQAYKELHRRVQEAGLYQCPYWSGYGPEVARYILLAASSAFAYKHNWLITSAVFLGLLWHQLVFTVHDLGHMGVTHNWTIDRLIGITIADFIGGLSIGWWVDNHNVHHLVTNHASHDPDIQHLPFFAISPVFLQSIYSSYYKRTMPFDAFSRIVIGVQHKLFYIVMAFARLNLNRLSYAHLVKVALRPKRAKGALWSWALECTGIVVFWCWYIAVLRGCGSWQKALAYMVVSNVVPSPLHVQIVLSHFSRSTDDLGPTESFPHRQLRTTVDVICPEYLSFLHGGLHLQVTHHLFPRLPRHNLRKASVLVKQFAKEEGLEYAEFGFIDGNTEIRGVLRNVAEQVKIMGKVAAGEAKEAIEKKNG